MRMSASEGPSRQSLQSDMPRLCMRLSHNGAAGLGTVEASKRFVEVMGLTWAYSQVTKVWTRRSAASPG